MLRKVGGWLVRRAKRGGENGETFVACAHSKDMASEAVGASMMMMMMMTPSLLYWS